jgi:hypothetical protein
VTYAAGPEAGTRVEGPRRGAHDASNLLDTQDHPPSLRGRASLPIGLWVALAAGVTIATAGLVDRRGDLVGLLRRTPDAPSAGLAAPGSSPAARPGDALRPVMTSPQPAAAPAPAATTSIGEAAIAPVTVSVESLPIAAPESISVDALPRAPEPAAATAPRRSRRHQ